MSTPPVYLVAGGKRYGGWTAVRIARSIETICGAFQLELVDRWAGQSQPWPIHEGTPCAIMVGDETLITGAVDRREVEWDAHSHRVSVTGRDAARNLVDCAAQLGVWEFSNVHPVDFITKLAKQHGIQVRSTLPVAALPLTKRHTLTPGETSGSAIETVCRVAGLLPISDGHGGLILTRAGTERCVTSLIEGENLLAARAAHDVSGRFRDVVVLGSHAGTDQDWGTPIISIRGSAQDPNAEAGRVTYVRPEVEITRAQAIARAQWEVAVRAARADLVSVQVQGWQQGDGSLWPLNRLVRLHSPLLEIDTDLLITQVTHSMSREEGSITEMELRRPDAYLPAPIVSDDIGRWSELARGV